MCRLEYADAFTFIHCILEQSPCLLRRKMMKRRKQCAKTAQFRRNRSGVHRLCIETQLRWRGGFQLPKCLCIRIFVCQSNGNGFRALRNHRSLWTAPARTEIDDLTRLCLLKRVLKTRQNERVGTPDSDRILQIIGHGVANARRKPRLIIQFAQMKSLHHSPPFSVCRRIRISSVFRRQNYTPIFPIAQMFGCYFAS